MCMTDSSGTADCLSAIRQRVAWLGATMSFALIDIAVSDKQAHPRLKDRTTGHVRAVLSEQADGREQVHELAIPVWADIPAGSTEEDIDMALMLKAASIIARLKATLGG